VPLLSKAYSRIDSWQKGDHFERKDRHFFWGAKE
jgi:hypothetical protein